MSLRSPRPQWVNHRENSPSGHLDHCTILPHLWVQQGAVANHWTRTQHQLHFDATFFILVREMWFNFRIDMQCHYNDVIMGVIASQFTSLTIVFSTVYSDADQRKHQSSASLALVRRIHQGPVNFPHKWPVTRKVFPCTEKAIILLEYSHLPLISFLHAGCSLL